ncbi:putative magnesium transporter NIPA4 [Vitis vinifera]|uniref:Probable magnesium transporter n=1 Tax=Vitis vinifera TaxID=29760 RepID=A0A438G463_VITVI|nr:putative magnesium transporter NIPA4 [Vitis vinifera]
MAAAGEEGAYSYKGMSADNIKGLVLALSSSFFIGASFIVKKKGLKKAGASGIRAGVGGYSYLYEPLWWVGMITMIVGEIANFAAYAFAPAILCCTCSYYFKGEATHFGILGCVLCVVGSTTIVLHAPQEREIQSVIEVWDLATEPAFLFYAALVITAVFVLIIHFIPQYGQTHIMVYIGVCSLVGSLSVMSVKALGIALKLTLSGMNQLTYPQTWAFTIVSEVLEARFKVLAETGRSLELEEKRKTLDLEVEFGFLLDLALDTFNTAVVSPIYYVMFTSLTILASVIMFKNSSYYFINSFLLLLLFFPLPLEYNSMDWDRQNPTQIVTEMCGFVTILSGTFLLHKTKDLSDGLSTSLSMRLSKHIEEDGFGQEGIPLRRQESLRLP